MTPEQKAKFLRDKFFWKAVKTAEQAKKCALITVDEILENTRLELAGVKYWASVKNEIEKL